MGEELKGIGIEGGQQGAEKVIEKVRARLTSPSLEIERLRWFTQGKEEVTAGYQGLWEAIISICNQHDQPLPEDFLEFSKRIIFEDLISSPSLTGWELRNAVRAIFGLAFIGLPESFTSVSSSFTRSQWSNLTLWNRLNFLTEQICQAAFPIYCENLYLTQEDTESFHDCWYRLTTGIILASDDLEKLTGESLPEGREGLKKIITDSLKRAKDSIPEEKRLLLNQADNKAHEAVERAFLDAPHFICLEADQRRLLQQPRKYRWFFCILSKLREERRRIGQIFRKK